VAQYSSQIFQLGRTGLKIRRRAHRWSSLWRLETPSLGSLLGVKIRGRSTTACGRWPSFPGDLLYARLHLHDVNACV